MRRANGAPRHPTRETQMTRSSVRSTAREPKSRSIATDGRTGLHHRHPSSPQKSNLGCRRTRATFGRLWCHRGHGDLRSCPEMQLETERNERNLEESARKVSLSLFPSSLERSLPLSLFFRALIFSQPRPSCFPLLFFSLHQNPDKKNSKKPPQPRALLDRAPLPRLRLRRGCSRRGRGCGRRGGDGGRGRDQHQPRLGEEDCRGAHRRWKLLRCHRQRRRRQCCCCISCCWRFDRQEDRRRSSSSGHHRRHRSGSGGGGSKGPGSSSAAEQP